MRRWVRRRGLVDERAAEDRSNEAPELSPLEACMQLSLVGSTYLRCMPRRNGATHLVRTPQIDSMAEQSYVVKLDGAGTFLWHHQLPAHTFLRLIRAARPSLPTTTAWT